MFSLPSGAIIGMAAGVVCYLAVHLKNKLGWDDALDVWGVHGIGGGLGVILLGVFASKAVNAGGADGLLAGGTHFFVVQCLAVIGAAIYAFLFTYLMLAVINLFTTVRVAEADEDLGLDASLHGERAYDSGHCKQSGAARWNTIKSFSFAICSCACLSLGLSLLSFCSARRWLSGMSPPAG